MIFSKNILFLAISFLLMNTSFGQKVKYKDLFVWLSSKQYGQAEPFLKKYLKDNDDNPNAFLFMGYIYEEKALMNDVLVETEKLSTNSDSAVLFFDKALKTIDEKELKKNDEYYQAYSRRDLRTGKFGLKLSDIQFDLEKRSKSIRERQQKVKSVKEKFMNLQRFYENCPSLYKTIVGQYQSQKEFHLRADENSLTGLNRLIHKYDSCLISFNDYKIALQALGKTGYNQVLEPIDIDDFKKDGYSSVDFFQDELKVWDYKRWAGLNMEIIENQVLPIHKSLIKLDAELNGLKDRIKTDSVSVAKDLPAVYAKIKETGLSKFDDKPMPFDVFNLKIKELEYGSELAQTRKLRDSSNLVLKLQLYKRQITMLSRMDSVVSLLKQRDFEYEGLNYKIFIENSYGSISNLKNLIFAIGDFAIKEKIDREKKIKKIEHDLNWVYDEGDSIPVSANVSSTKYFPLSIVTDSYTFGLTFKDTTSFAYFYNITPGRKATVKVIHKLDSAIFQKINIPLIKGISVTDGSQEQFYIVMYSEEKRGEKTPALVYRVTKKDGLVWSNFYLLDGIPVETVFGKENGDLSLKLASANGNKLVVIQKDGKLL